jgi:hypothetical protein
MATDAVRLHRGADQRGTHGAAWGCMRTLLPTLLVFIFTACAHSRTDGLTVAENKTEAAIHEARAENQIEQYDPTRIQTDLRPGPLDPNSLQLNEFTYNPTESHQTAADAELREAGEHLRAAKKLETFEDAACRDLPAGERSSCPLLGSSVRQIRQTTQGFQLTMKASVDVADVNRRLNCHLAYARATGFDRPSCPLFVKGTTIKRIGASVIDFSGDTRAIAADLQGQARRIFAPGEPRPVSSL